MIDDLFTSELPVPFTVMSTKPASSEDLRSSIKKTIESLIIQKTPLSKELPFIKKPLTDLLVYTQKIAHTIATFLRVMLGFDFESPLNFIMLQEDFHSFFRMFYHTQMLMKYSINILTDSLFSIYHLRNPKDTGL
jgi:hypothetical protein